MHFPCYNCGAGLHDSEETCHTCEAPVVLPETEYDEIKRLRADLAAANEAVSHWGARAAQHRAEADAYRAECERLAQFARWLAEDSVKYKGTDAWAAARKALTEHAEFLKRMGAV